ncbi:MAG: cysteine synthase, partial [Myxococcota bacterium]
MPFDDPLLRSIGDFIGNTPLVRLYNIGRGLPCPILVKCEHLNPGGSIKDRIALAIIERGIREGTLTEGSTIVEATAGNTGIGLALVAAGHYPLICVMPEKMSLDKRSALRALGAEVVITPNLPPDHPDSFQQVARRLAEPDGFMLADQFRNPANPDVHFRTTGPEIWDQAEHLVGAFVAGVGTGGTISGVGRFLKSQNASIEI